MLSAEEIVLCAGPSADITKFDSFSLEMDYGRIVRFTGEETDRRYSKMCSSYISTSGPDQSIAFGQISFVFTHRFNGSTSALAYIHWFNR